MLGGCRRGLVLHPLLVLSMMSNGVALPYLILNLNMQFLTCYIKEEFITKNKIKDEFTNFNAIHSLNQQLYALIPIRLIEKVSFHQTKDLNLNPIIQ